MSVCVYLDTCPFFKDGPGYSPELHESMKQRYCLGDSSDCARLLVMECVPRPDIPEDLLPTDIDRLRLICEEAGIEPPTVPDRRE